MNFALKLIFFFCMIEFSMFAQNGLTEEFLNNSNDIPNVMPIEDVEWKYRMGLKEGSDLNINFKTSGTITFDSIEYQQLYLSVDDDEYMPIGGLRSENNKIYLRLDSLDNIHLIPNMYCPFENILSEILLYDYNIYEQDTTLKIFDYGQSTGCLNDSIDLTYFDNEDYTIFLSNVRREGFNQGGNSTSYFPKVGAYTFLLHYFHEDFESITALCEFNYQGKSYKPFGDCSEIVPTDYISSNNPFKIYPNPSNSLVQIELNESAKLEIYNANGKLCFESLMNGMKQIDISQFDNGIYFVKAITEDSIFHQTFVKQ